MESQKDENLVQLNGRVPESLRDLFWSTVPKGTLNQHVMSASARLWVSLPADLRKQLIDAESEGKSPKNSFNEAVRKIVIREIQKLNQKKK